MASIVTVTFSPCIDISTSVQSLVPDKKLRCADPVHEPGGGGINVARALKKLGGEATAVYPAGGCSGKRFNALLEQEGVKGSMVEAREETRENIVVVDESNKQQYRLGMPGKPLSEREWQDCLNRVDQLNAEWIVASGSIPPGVPEDIFARLAQLARKKKAKLIVDTSGKALCAAVEEGVFLIKPNISELSSVAGKKEIHLEMVDDVAREIIGRGKSEIIVISLGAAGAMLVSRDEELHAVPPAVMRQSTVGAGDSMVAGMVLKLAEKSTLREVLYFGVACGTAATMNPGTELCRKEDVDRLYRLISKRSA